MVRGLIPAALLCGAGAAHGQARITEADPATPGLLEANLAGSYTTGWSEGGAADVSTNAYGGGVQLRLWAFDLNGGTFGFGAAQPYLFGANVEADGREVASTDGGHGDLQLDFAGTRPLGDARFGMRLYVELPTGADEVSSDSVDYGLSLAFTVPFGSVVEGVFGLGGNINGEADGIDRADAYELALGVRFRAGALAVMPATSLTLLEAGSSGGGKNAFIAAGGLTLAYDVNALASLLLETSYGRDLEDGASGRAFAASGGVQLRPTLF